MPDHRIAWLNCSSGVAGDMLLGSLLDAGASLEYVEKILSGLHLPGWTLTTEHVQRSGIQATKACVLVNDDHVKRDYQSIVTMLNNADLPDRVRERSQSVFHALAEAEALIHGTQIEHVHFHEVGGHDALVDIVGTMAALEDLGIDDLYVSPVALGQGTVRTDHGTIPNPAPATVVLLEGFQVIGTNHLVELATPTGAAILKALAAPLTPMPQVTVFAQGFGAGTRELDDRANVVGVVLGTQGEDFDEMIGLIETTLDDVTGEVIGAALNSLIELGALDAWATSVTMKKDRPGSVLSVLCEPTDSVGLAKEVLRLTGSLGVRTSLVSRTILRRSFVTVDVLGMPVRIKVSAMRAKPEFDDVMNVANAKEMTVTEIDALAIASYLKTRADQR